MAKKNRIPRKIAGVKIPKALRKKSLIKSLLGSPTGRQVIADALQAAAGAAAVALVATRAAGGTKTGAATAHPGEDGAQVAKRALKSAAGALTDVLSNAEKAALSREAATRTRHPQRPARPH
jgi:hypothetical protein